MNIAELEALKEKSDKLVMEAIGYLQNNKDFKVTITEMEPLIKIYALACAKEAKLPEEYMQTVFDDYVESSVLFYTMGYLKRKNDG